MHCKMFSKSYTFRLRIIIDNKVEAECLLTYIYIYVIIQEKVIIMVELCLIKLMIQSSNCISSASRDQCHRITWRNSNYYCTKLNHNYFISSEKNLTWKEIEPDEPAPLSLFPVVYSLITSVKMATPTCSHAW